MGHKYNFKRPCIRCGELFTPIPRLSRKVCPLCLAKKGRKHKINVIVFKEESIINLIDEEKCLLN